VLQATGTIKLFPGDPLRFKMKNEFVALNNKVMELRKVRSGVPLQKRAPAHVTRGCCTRDKRVLLM